MDIGPPPPKFQLTFFFFFTNFFFANLTAGPLLSRRLAGESARLRAVQQQQHQPPPPPPPQFSETAACAVPWFDATLLTRVFPTEDPDRRGGIAPELFDPAAAARTLGLGGPRSAPPLLIKNFVVSPCRRITAAIVSPVGLAERFSLVVGRPGYGSRRRFQPVAAVDNVFDVVLPDDRHVFFSRQDELQRPHAVWCSAIRDLPTGPGARTTPTASTAAVFSDPDPSSVVDLHLSSCGGHVIVTADGDSRTAAPTCTLLDALGHNGRPVGATLAEFTSPRARTLTIDTQRLPSILNDFDDVNLSSTSSSSSSSSSSQNKNNTSSIRTTTATAPQSPAASIVVAAVTERAPPGDDRQRITVIGSAAPLASLSGDPLAWRRRGIDAETLLEVTDTDTRVVVDVSISTSACSADALPPGGGWLTLATIERELPLLQEQLVLRRARLRSLQRHSNNIMPAAPADAELVAAAKVVLTAPIGGAIAFRSSDAPHIRRVAVTTATADETALFEDSVALAATGTDMGSPNLSTTTTTDPTGPYICSVVQVPCRPVAAGADHRAGLVPSSWPMRRPSPPADRTFPMTVVARRDLAELAATPGPIGIIVESYGVYGDDCSVALTAERRRWLDGGWILATAHIRGGGELGSAWHGAGIGANRADAVDDLIRAWTMLRRGDLAHQLPGLFPGGGTEPPFLVARATSAGAVPLAAALLARPELADAAIMRVPFLDPIGAATDPLAPLSALEMTEWCGRPGRPLEGDLQMSGGGGGSKKAARNDPDFPARGNAGLAWAARALRVTPGPHAPMLIGGSTHDYRAPCEPQLRHIEALRAATTLVESAVSTTAGREGRGGLNARRFPGSRDFSVAWIRQDADHFGSDDWDSVERAWLERVHAAWADVHK
jgi:hypothetical protein